MIYIQSGRRLHLWALSRPVPSLTFWSCFLPAGGLPRTLTTDNGPQLVSAEFTSYIQSKGIKHIRTAYYHPQSNGGVERFNQSQNNGLRAHLAQGYSFNKALSLLHYRAAQHATTGLPLHRLCPPTSHGGNPVVKARVREQQLKARSRFDAKKKARIPRISGLDAGSAATPEK